MLNNRPETGPFPSNIRFTFDSNPKQDLHACPKQDPGRRPEDEPTIEMTLAEVEEMLRKAN